MPFSVAGTLIFVSGFSFQANTRRLPKVGLMMAQRRRRWANSEPTLGERLVFAGLPPDDLA